MRVLCRRHDQLLRDSVAHHALGEEHAALDGGVDRAVYEYGVQEYGVQECRSAGVQEYGVQGCRSAGVVITVSQTPYI
jgi:hypothetical protein